ncbi:MAG: hypothetical protein ACREX4_09005 [Gammaproteobacteria bacterium]
MSSQTQPTENAALGHKFGTFIEGFDSILYNSETRASNQDRFLAEFFYGLIYDSALVLAEPMVFDNHTMIRLLRRMQHDNRQYLLGAIHYAPFRQPLVSLEKTFFNPAYVCSSLSETANKERCNRLRKLNEEASVSEKATALIKWREQPINCTEDDLVAIDNSINVYQKNDTPWQAGNECRANAKHDYKMHCQVQNWLDADCRYRHVTLQSPQSLWARVSETLKCPDVQPFKIHSQQKENLHFEQYFANRSNFHSTKTAWRQALGDADFGRLEEYVNSAYMIAIQTTCNAATAVRTPTAFGNPHNEEAQTVMNKSAGNALAFEFKLSLKHLEPDGDTDGNQPRSPTDPDKLEAELLEHLDELHKMDSFIEARNKLGAVNRSDPDYRDKYTGAFNTLADLVNELQGPFRLLTQGNMVVNIIKNVCHCGKEIDPTDTFPDANGCEHKE